MNRVASAVKPNKPSDTRNLSEKTKMKKSHILMRLWRYLKKSKYLLLLACVCTVASDVFSLVGPYLSGKAIGAIEHGAGKVDFKSVFIYVGAMAVFFVLSAALSYAVSVIMITISRNTVYEMRKDISAKLQRLPVSFFDKYQPGDIISIVSYDIDTVNASLSTDIVQVMTSVITVTGSLVMMIKIKPMLVLVFAITVPMSIFFTRFMAKRVRPLFKRRSAQLGVLNGFSEEYIGGLKTTKAYGKEDVIISRYSDKNIEAAQAYCIADSTGSKVGPTINFINNLSLTLVSVFGSFMYLSGKIALEGISSFVLYSRKFSGPINELANIMSEFQSSFAAADRVFTLLDTGEEKPDSDKAMVLKEVRGEVELKNVCFGYDTDKIILHDLSFKVPGGGLVAIVGPTGAGKTTIINLLMRFYDAQSGSITIDGHDIYDVTRKSLRSSFSMVLQDTWLFGGTIFDNIAYGKENVTRSEVENAAKSAKIHDFIMTLPKGYDTVLSDNGVNISKGQKQLLTIARAFLIEANMLILDEATSNVDTATEIQIQKALSELMKGKTCFVIAHRLSTIRSADIILVVKDGDIVERGNHESLMKLDGFYKQLYNSQFDYTE